MRDAVLEICEDRPITEIELDGKWGEVHYEVEYLKDGQDWEIELAEDGTVLKHELDD